MKIHDAGLDAGSLPRWQNLDVTNQMRAWEAWKRANPTSWVHQLANGIDTLALEGAECRGVGHRATAHVAENVE